MARRYVIYDERKRIAKEKLAAKEKLHEETALLPDETIAATVAFTPTKWMPEEKLVPRPSVFKDWMGEDARKVWGRAFILLCKQPPPKKKSESQLLFREPREYRKLAAKVAEYYVWNTTPREERTPGWPKFYELCEGLGLTPGKLKLLLARVKYDLWKNRYRQLPTDEERLQELKDLAYAKAQEITDLPITELTGGAAQLLRTAMEQHGGANGKSVSVNIDARQQSLTVVNDKEMRELFLAAVEENKRLLRDVGHEVLPDEN